MKIVSRGRLFLNLIAFLSVLVGLSFDTLTMNFALYLKKHSVLEIQSYTTQSQLGK